MQDELVAAAFERRRLCSAGAVAPNALQGRLRTVSCCGAVLPLYVPRGFTPFFFFQAEDGIRDIGVTGVQTCALPICACTPPLPEVLRLWDFLFAYGPHLNILCIVAQLVMIRTKIMESPRYVLQHLRRRSEERRVGKGCRSWRSPCQ